MNQVIYGASIFAIILSFNSCNSDPASRTTVNDPDSVKAIILNIQHQMQAAYYDKSHGAQKYSSFCEDSVLSAYNGDFIPTSIALSKVLPVGTIVPPHDFIANSALNDPNGVRHLQSKIQFYHKRLLSVIFFILLRVTFNCFLI